MFLAKHRRFNPFAIVSLSVLSICVAVAQDITVPVELQISLFKKILTFNRNLEKWSDGELVVGVLFQSRFRRSLSVKNEFFSRPGKMPEDTLGRQSIKFEAIDLSETADWQAEASARHVNVLYLAPLHAIDVKEIFQVSQTRRWVTWTGVIEYVDAGCSFGIVLKDDRPSIKINLPASRSEGTDFSSQLLKLVQVVSNPKG
jgi:hypothetical protein